MKNTAILIDLWICGYIDAEHTSEESVESSGKTTLICISVASCGKNIGNKKYLILFGRNHNYDIVLAFCEYLGN